MKIQSHGWAPEAEDYYNAILALAREDGIQVESKMVLSYPGCLGVSYGGRVELSVCGTFLERFWTFVHEYAHEVLHGPQERQQVDRKGKEVEASAVAFLVSDYFCLAKMSVPAYIAFHGGGASDLADSSEIITRCSLFLITRIKKKMDAFYEQGTLRFR